MIAVRGTRRTIRWMEFEQEAVADTSDLPIDVQPDEVLMSETIVIHQDEVDAGELKAVDVNQSPSANESKVLTFALGLLD